ncbi:MAG: radical SAM protein [Candidatus Taylorbacteria bacterium]|nr:radical SAM protein [Candidatus Taylorbacteria bacterium]
MKIAFLYPRWTGEYGLFGHFAKRNSTWMPQNIALLAAIAEQHGYTASIIDAQAEDLSREELVNRAIALKPDIYAFTCYSPFAHINADSALDLKNAGVKESIIVGGPHATILKEKFLEQYPQFDYVFVGEAEESLPNFLATYEQGGDLSKTDGVMFKKDGKVVVGKPQWIPATIKITGKTYGQEFILDRYPFPARHLLPMKKYRLGTADGRTHFTSIHTMRGCPWHCIFCASDAINTTRMAMRSPRSVVDEIKQVQRDYPYITHIFFSDDVLTLWYDQHMKKICDLILEEGIKITFESSTRANLVEDEMVAHMAKAGLVRMSMGLETVNTQMRDTMRKQVKLEDYTKALKIFDKYRVEGMTSVMIGLPGETPESYEELGQWLDNTRVSYQANVAIAVPYPGTEFNDIAVSGSHGVELMSEDFSKYLRYGKAVTKVGEFTSEDLIVLQNRLFIRVYSKWWRWKPMYNKHGIMGFALLGVRIYRDLKYRLFGKKVEPAMTHPKN